MTDPQRTEPDSLVRDARERSRPIPGVLQTAAVVVTVVIGGWAIAAMKSFLVPIVLAVFAYVLVRALDRLWGRIRIGGRAIPHRMSTILSAALVTALGFGVVQLVAENAAGVANASGAYAQRLDVILHDLLDDFGDWLPIGDDEEPPARDAEDDDLIDWLLRRINVQGLASRLASSLASIVGTFALVLVYLYFLLLERPFFDRKLRGMVRNDDDRDEIRTLLGRIDHDVSVYVGLKSLVSLMTAVPSYVIMLWVGLDFAEFWAILIFALNFIPNVGSLIATVLPSLIALVQFETLTPFWIVFLGVITIQLVVANLIEPNLLGKRLNISPLVVIVALVGWSLMWGVAGAFLCVPMTNIAILVLANIPSTRWLAVLLSRDGNLTEEVAA